MVPAMTLAERWEIAEPFEQWISRAVTHHDLWNELWRRVTVEDVLVAGAAALPEHWRLLVLTEDWCGDAVNALPVIARLAERAPERLELRCLDRDEHLELIDDHLTNGARSIPKVLMIDARWQVRGTWGPRPAELQEWVFREGRSLVKDERYKRIRAWYARDKGATTLRELLAVLESAAVTR